MAFLKRLIDFILFGNLYVALGSAFLIQSTIIQCGFNDPVVPFCFMSFFATLFVYNFQRIFYTSQKNSNLHSIRRKWVFTNIFFVKMLSLTGFLGVCIAFFFNDFRSLFYLFPLFILSIAYFSPFTRLRKNPWFKLITLVTVWTMVTAVVPMLLNHSMLFTKTNLIHIAVRFCFMAAICIPFDIRDSEIDKADNTRTLPHFIGIKASRRLAIGFMIVYMLLIMVEYKINMLSIQITITLLFCSLINMVFLLMSSSKRSEYFYVAGVDGTMIVQGALLMLMHHFIK